MRNRKWTDGTGAKRRRVIRVTGGPLAASLLAVIALVLSLFGYGLPGEYKDSAVAAPLSQSPIQEGEWAEPVLISTQADTASSWFPDVTVDSQGEVHVVWDSLLPARTLDEEGLGLTMYSARTLDGNWLEPNDIATGAGTEISRPAIVADRQGLLHIVFRPSGDAHYAQASADDAYSAQAWRHLHRLDRGGANYSPDVALDSQGGIHAVWPEQVPVELSEELAFYGRRALNLSDVLYRRSLDGGATWGASVNLSRTPNVGSGRVQIEIDDQDVIHVAWDEGWDRNAPADLAGSAPVCGAYVRSMDGGNSWSELQILGTMQPVSEYPSDEYSPYEIGLRVLLSRMDQTSRRYSEALVYQRSLLENIFEAREPDNSEADIEALEAERSVILAMLDELTLSELGVTFDELYDEDISAAEYELPDRLLELEDGQFTLGVDNAGGVLLVWRSVEAQRLYYAWSEDRGLTWTPVASVPGIYARPWSHTFDTYDMATDSLGRIHLVMVATRASPELRQPPLGVYHLQWEGERWSDPEPIAYYSAGPAVPENPKMAIERGNHLHVVWYLRPAGDWADDTQIWYSEMETDAVAEEVAPVPTATVTPTSIPRLIPAPTATPFPTVASEVPILLEDLYTETDDLERLGLALSPVLLAVIIVILIRSFWKGRSFK